MISLIRQQIILLVLFGAILGAWLYKPADWLAQAGLTLVTIIGSVKASSALAAAGTKDEPMQVVIAPSKPGEMVQPLLVVGVPPESDIDVTPIPVVIAPGPIEPVAADAVPAGAAPVEADPEVKNDPPA